MNFTMDKKNRTPSSWSLSCLQLLILIGSSVTIIPRDQRAFC